MSVLPPGLDAMHPACMRGVLVQIRDVEADVRDRLKQHAAAQGGLLELLPQGPARTRRCGAAAGGGLRRLRERGDLVQGLDREATARSLQLDRQSRSDELDRRRSS